MLVFLITVSKIESSSSALKVGRLCRRIARLKKLIDSLIVCDTGELYELLPTGNDFMKAEKYTEAITAYSDAIMKDPTNAVFYSNRYVQ